MVGKFVYHCHIVGHEDAGMMQNVEVVQPRSKVAELWDMVRDLASNQLPEYLGGTVQTVADDPAPWPYDEASICRGPSARQRAEVAAR